MDMDMCNADNQRLAGDWVRDHVVQNCWELIDILQKCYDHLDSEEQEAIDALRQCPPDYEGAAYDKGWMCRANALGNEVYVQTEGKYYDYEASARFHGWDLANVDELEVNDDVTPACTFVREAGATFESTRKHCVFADEDDAWEQLCKDLGLELFYEMDEDSDDWEDLCDTQGIDADDYRADIYEYYIVDDVFKRWVDGYGVFQTIAGFTVWGRPCTGQAICLDYPVMHAALEFHKKYGD